MKPLRKARGVNPLELHLRNLSRRELFQRVGCGIGGLALASLLKQDGCWAQAPTAKAQGGQPFTDKLPHFPARAIKYQSDLIDFVNRC